MCRWGREERVISSLVEVEIVVVRVLFRFDRVFVIVVMVVAIVKHWARDALVLFFVQAV